MHPPPLRRPTPYRHHVCPIHRRRYLLNKLLHQLLALRRVVPILFVQTNYDPLLHRPERLKQLRLIRFQRPIDHKQHEIRILR